MLWRVDRVFMQPPDRRRYVVFAGFVSAKTYAAAWSAARVWFSEHGHILVRAASYQRTTSPQLLRSLELPVVGVTGTEVANGNARVVGAPDAVPATRKEGVVPC